MQLYRSISGSPPGLTCTKLPPTTAGVETSLPLKHRFEVSGKASRREGPEQKRRAHELRKAMQTSPEYDVVKNRGA